MHPNSKTDGGWIVDRLMAIKALERELSDVLANGNATCGACLRTRVRQLNSWVESLDRALDASKTGRLNLVSNRNQSHNRRTPALFTA